MGASDRPLRPRWPAPAAVPWGCAWIGTSANAVAVTMLAEMIKRLMLIPASCRFERGDSMSLPRERFMDRGGRMSAAARCDGSAERRGQVATLGHLDPIERE